MTPSISICRLLFGHKRKREGARSTQEKTNISTQKMHFHSFQVEFRIDDENHLSFESFLNCQGFPEIKGKLNIKD